MPQGKELVEPKQYLSPSIYVVYQYRGWCACCGVSSSCFGIPTHIVGVERVIAGSDCGFGTFAGFGAIDPSIAYAKLGALSEGAALASARA